MIFGQLVPTGKFITYVFLEDHGNWWEIIYVGSSKKGLRRPLGGHKHHRQMRRDGVNLLDATLVWHHKTFREASRHETELIAQWNPRYNIKKRHISLPSWFPSSQEKLLDALNIGSRIDRRRKWVQFWELRHRGQSLVFISDRLGISRQHAKDMSKRLKLIMANQRADGSGLRKGRVSAHPL